MQSWPKKTSEAMFDWMATTALKILINTILSTFTDIQENSLGCLFCLKNINFSERYTRLLLNKTMCYLVTKKNFGVNHS